VIKVRLRITAFGTVLLMAMGCGQDEKIATLEKQNQELKAQVEKSHATADYDLQAKCSKDARAWFNENWASTKDAILLDFTNHYNKSLNKCFILVEYHYSNSFAGTSGWTNNMSLWDVYENSKYATFAENHTTYFKPTVHTEQSVVICELLGKKCMNIGEFNDATLPYMSN
jgi:hypothetical protein